ncbi:MAG: General secretory pathway protein E, partial [Negativicoccus succinicivorans DORA_17_25]
MTAQEMATPKTAVHALLTQAVAAGASDVHFEPQEDGLRVRFRIHGKLWETTQLPGTFAPSVANYIKALAHMNMAEKRLPLDGSCTFETGNRKYDLRISSLPVFYGEKIVVRILGNPLFVPQLERLGLLPAAQSLLVRELRRSA